jgi:hypothetical protein
MSFLAPETFASSPLDFTLPFFLLDMFYAHPYTSGPRANTAAEAVSRAERVRAVLSRGAAAVYGGFIAQLQLAGLWHWAVYVALLAAKVEDSACGEHGPRDGDRSR